MESENSGVTVPRAERSSLPDLVRYGNERNHSQLVMANHALDHIGNLIFYLFLMTGILTYVVIVALKGKLEHAG